MEVGGAGTIRREPEIVQTNLALNNGPVRPRKTGISCTTLEATVRGLRKLKASSRAV